jgi:hypothetical protein
MQTIEDRVHALVDNRLFKAFWDAATHFGTNDLVLYFDETEDEPLSVLPRKKLASGPNLPESLRKIQKHPNEAAKQLTAADTAFWFVVKFADGEGACLAINAKSVAPGGSA